MNTTTKRQFKDNLYEQFARIGKALASPVRLELLDLLVQTERSVEDLAREMDMPIANCSQHLQILRAAQLVTTRREGTFIYYRLADERVFRVWQAMRDLGEARLAEIDRIVETFLTERHSLEPISAQEVMQRLQEGTIVLLDVRPEAEYRTGHLPHARSIPVEELEQRLEELPGDQEIIAYCRGPYCVFADEAVAILRARGYRVRRLNEGVPDWRELGFPVKN